MEDAGTLEEEDTHSQASNISRPPSPELFNSNNNNSNDNHNNNNDDEARSARVNK